MRNTISALGMAILLVLLLGAAWARNEELHQQANSSSAHVVKRTFDWVGKKTFSGNLRFIFVAGLEGTSHHAWKTVFDDCSSHPSQFPFVCTHDETLSTLLYYKKGKLEGKGLGLFNAGTEDTFLQAKLDVIKRLDVISRKAANFTVPRIYVLNLGHGKKSGMQSYPNYGGPDKAIQHPNMHLLAQLAEESNVDLRILVLRRNAKAILESTVVHRHYGSLNHQAKVLSDNAVVLHGQLFAIDGAFYKCVVTMKMSRDDQVNKLGPFLFPGFGAQNARVFKPIKASNDLGDLKELATPAARAVTSTLASAVGLIDSMC